MSTSRGDANSIFNLSPTVPLFLDEEHNYFIQTSRVSVRFTPAWLYLLQWRSMCVTVSSSTSQSHMGVSEVPVLYSCRCWALCRATEFCNMKLQYHVSLAKWSLCQQQVWIIHRHVFLCCPSWHSIYVATTVLIFLKPFYEHQCPAMDVTSGGEASPFVITWTSSLVFWLGPYSICFIGADVVETQTQTSTGRKPHGPCIQIIMCNQLTMDWFRGQTGPCTCSWSGPLETPRTHLHCVPTFKLSVTFSNLNRFLEFSHCWKTYEIRYKTYDTTHLLPTPP